MSEFKKIGGVIVSHGQVANELLAAAETVVGAQNHIAAVSIGWHDDVEMAKAEIHRAIKQVSQGNGVLLLTDMFGGTPSNLAISCMSQPKVEVVAGINLPMLVKLAKVRGDQSLADAVSAAQDAGRKYVTIASRVLAGK